MNSQTASKPAALTDSLGMQTLRACAQAANRALRSLQKSDGHWCAELEGDSILQSEYLLMKWILSQEDAPMVDGRPADTLLKMVRQLRAQQRDNGGWGQYPGSDIDLSATVKGYFCLNYLEIRQTRRT